MEATFILALLSHGYKVRASTLYHLLKGKRTSSVLIYGFYMIVYGSLVGGQRFPNKPIFNFLKNFRRRNKFSITKRQMKFN